MRKRRNLALYRLSYVLNSTALVMPVLPFWWTEAMGVSTSLYLSVLAAVSAVSTLIDIPLSFAADRFGVKYFYLGGLIVFSGSFVVVATASNAAAFYLYAFLNTCAEGLMAGANTALLKEICDETEARDELFAVNRMYYLATSLLFFVGVGLYLLMPRVLFWVQAASLLASGVLVGFIELGHPRQTRVQTSPVALGRLGHEEFRGALRYLAGLLALVSLLGYFSGAVQFQNRTIQLLSGSLEVEGLEPLWLTAAFLFVGNLVTAGGVGSRVARSLKALRTTGASMLLLGIAGCAGLLLWVSSFWSALVGYLLFCVLKGAYRAEYMDVALRTVPIRGWDARWLSIVNTLSSLVASGLNLVVSALVGSDVTEVQLTWSVGAMIAGVICIPLLLCSRGASLPVSSRGMSPKRSSKLFFFDRHEPPRFVQTYESLVDCDSLGDLHEFVAGRHELCAPEFHGVVRRSDGSSELSFEFVDMPNLYEMRSERRWSSLVESGLLRDLVRRAPLSARERDDLRGCSVGCVSNLEREVRRMCTCMVCSHGDINPGNLLVGDGQYVLVDWDLAGTAPRLLDEFSAVFHPDVPAGADERMRALKGLVDGHEQACQLRQANLADVVRSLLAAKIRDCRAWNPSEEQARLVRAYEALLVEVERSHMVKGV